MAVQYDLGNSIWNLATVNPNIDVYVDIEDYDIDVYVDIEYSNLDIDATRIRYRGYQKTSISTKLRYRRLELRYRVLKSKHFDIVVWVLRYQYRCYSISKVTLLHIGSYIEDTRYRSLETSISKIL